MAKQKEESSDGDRQRNGNRDHHPPVLSARSKISGVQASITAEAEAEPNSEPEPRAEARKVVVKDQSS